MADPNNGLRFDIYERVQLPDEAASIEDLEEIELLPYMQALTQGDQIVLKGHLLLSGVYRPSESDTGGARLEHQIPVEISLPPSRVQRVEDLTVTIDNFDVDLLSSRSLNVTGVLALMGLQDESQPPPIWRDDSFTVVHQAQPSEAAYDGQPEEKQEDVQFPDGLRFEPQEQLEEEAKAQTKGASEQDEDGADAAGQSEAAQFDADQSDSAQAEAAQPDAFRFGAFQSDAAQSEAAQFDAAQSGTDQLTADEAMPQEFREESAPPLYAEAPPEDAGDQAALAEESRESNAASSSDEKPELKVALGGKTLDAAAPAVSGVGLLSALSEKSAVQDSELRGSGSVQAEIEENAPSSASTGDEVEWTKLFLSRSSEAQPFSKVRMCIVQRDDTLESIAARYNVQVRDLQNRNQLSEPHLSEGQVLYIP